MRGSCFCLDLLPHLSCRFVSTWKGTLRMPSKRTRLTRSGSWMLGWPRSRNNSWGIVKLSPVVGGRPSKWGCLVPCTSRVWGLAKMSCGSSCGKCWTSWAFMMEVSVLLTGFTGNREATFGEIFNVHSWDWLKMYEQMCWNISIYIIFIYAVYVHILQNGRLKNRFDSLQVGCLTLNAWTLARSWQYGLAMMPPLWMTQLWPSPSNLMVPWPWPLVSSWPETWMTTELKHKGWSYQKFHSSKKNLWNSVSFGPCMGCRLVFTVLRFLSLLHVGVTSTMTWWRINSKNTWQTWVSAAWKSASSLTNPFQEQLNTFWDCRPDGMQMRWLTTHRKSPVALAPHVPSATSTVQPWPWFPAATWCAATAIVVSGCASVPCVGKWPFRPREAFSLTSDMISIDKQDLFEAPSLHNYRHCKTIKDSITLREVDFNGWLWGRTFLSDDASMLQRAFT